MYYTGHKKLLDKIENLYIIECRTFVLYLRRFILTEENFKYRTNPLFLRNEFDSKEEGAMPIIPKPQSDITINSD